MTLQYYILRQAINLGSPLVRTGYYVSNLMLMVYLSFRSTYAEKARGLFVILRVILFQIYYTGMLALPIISVLACATGAIIIFYTLDQATMLGGGDVASKMLYTLVVKEIGPLLTGLIVVARSGTAVSSELGSMKVHGEVDALNVMGIDPLSYIVFPRIMGGVVSVICLAFYFNLLAIGSGFVVSNLLEGVQLRLYLTSFIRAVEPQEILPIFLKSFANGIMIFSVCCYQGLRVRRSPHEIPQVTTSAVVVSICLITIVNLIITTLTFLQTFSR